MTTWRHYARREFPRVVLELGLACARPQPHVDRCPRHNAPLGAITHFCESCFEEVWAEVGRRYVDQGRSTQTSNNEKEET